MILVIVGLATVFWFIRGEQFAERLQDTTGSGRNILYFLIFQGFVEAEGQRLLFGHGSMAVQVLTGDTLGLREGAIYGLQAHSDWLTLAYDFGILGITVFLVAHFAILIKLRRLRHRLTDLYVKLLPVYPALFLNSVFSEILFNTSLLFLYVCLGIISSPQKFRMLLHDT